MLTIVFYTENGAAAKVRAREIAAVKGDYARIYDAAVWDGLNRDNCDVIEIMPDVPRWQRDRIMAVYGEKLQDATNKKQTIIDEILDSNPMSITPIKNQTEKKAVHKGGGRWFVMAGEERLSGPHDKAEAQRLAAEPEVVTA